MAGEGVILKLQRLVGPALLRSFNKEERRELNRISCHRGKLKRLRDVSIFRMLLHAKVEITFKVFRWLTVCYPTQRKKIKEMYIKPFFLKNLFQRWFIVS